jgi:GT2 family glycosyltransferase
MSTRTTIVVSPRERFTSLPVSLRSLFATVPAETRVIVVEGGSPESVRKELSVLKSARDFDWIQLDYMVIPNEARNIGGRLAETEFIVFADNDIAYEAGWLEALEANADAHGSDAVAPLIFIGPSDKNLIHHAGGKLEMIRKGGKTVLVERHRLMNRPFAEVKAALANEAPVENEVCEFHCTFMTRDFFERLGGFDERLITREQMDFALRIKELGAKITFEKDSRVTYMAYEAFNPIDLPYHLFRWSDARALESIEVFEATWDIPLNRRAIRYNWIEQHRDRAWASAYPKAKLIGRHAYRLLHANKAEAEMNAAAEALRPQSAPFIPALPTRTATELFKA